MKKSLLTVTLVIVLLFCKAQAVTFGFLESECGIIPNPSYYFENTTSTHGGGYVLYHNGKRIYSDYNTFGAVYGTELRFIDGTTGFFITTSAGPFDQIFKIIGDSVIYLGITPGTTYSLFILSRHTVYIGSYIDEGTELFFISRLCDLRPKEELIYNETMVRDTTLFDTAIGEPFCTGITELNYRINATTATGLYTIRFTVDTLSSINQTGKPDIEIFPNPAIDFIQINYPSNELNNPIQIFDELGIIRKSLIRENVGGSTIYIGDLKKGIYFVVLNNTTLKRVFKLIKI
jgi:hypothetical protein